MAIEEITVGDLEPGEFIVQKKDEIASIVRDGIAINALSGGVDSSVVTVLGHKALGNKLKTFFINNGLMRQDEPEQVVAIFQKMGIPVHRINAQDSFFNALKGLTDPEAKREAITQTFYKDIFARLAEESWARYLIQGTNFTDVEETVAGIKRQHNVLEQLGIDTKKKYGYKVIEPLIQLRKPAIRALARASGLPREIITRIPFPGPGLAIRVEGEVTRERVAIVRKATKIVEDELSGIGAFQYLAFLREGRVAGTRDGQRDYGLSIEVRSWQSEDARIARPSELSYVTLMRLSNRITAEVPEVVSVSYNITTKPTSTIEPG